MPTRTERKAAMRTIYHPGLPKAGPIFFEWDWSLQRFGFRRMRFANFGNFRCGWLIVTCPLPWLEHSARALHPHLFDGSPIKSGMTGEGGR